MAGRAWLWLSKLRVPADDIPWAVIDPGVSIPGFMDVSPGWGWTAPSSFLLLCFGVSVGFFWQPSPWLWLSVTGRGTELEKLWNSRLGNDNLLLLERGDRKVLQGGSRGISGRGWDHSRIFLDGSIPHNQTRGSTRLCDTKILGFLWNPKIPTPGEALGLPGQTQQSLARVSVQGKEKQGNKGFFPRVSILGLSFPSLSGSSGCGCRDEWRDYPGIAESSLLGLGVGKSQ